MPTSTGSYAMDIFSAVLADRPTTLDEIKELVRRHEPEGLYLEYKRGIWFDTQPDAAYEFRRYASGFANAEGGLFIVGIVGGEDAQGPAQWTIEGVAACPSAAGWTAWLSHVLQDVVIRARVRWQSLKTSDGKDIVLVAVDRAQELIRLHKKPALECHLRVGDQTVRIDETLYADLVLGRRVKPDLELTAQEVRVGSDAGGHYMSIEVTVQNDGLVWVPDMKVAWVGYASVGISASESLRRQLDVRPPDPRDSTAANLILSIGGDEAWNQRDRTPGGSWLPRRSVGVRALAPFEAVKLATQIRPFPDCKGDVDWIWCGAVLVTPMNGSPLWAQIAAHAQGSAPAKAEGWIPDKGQPPLVALFSGEAAKSGILGIRPSGRP